MSCPLSAFRPQRSWCARHQDRAHLRLLTRYSHEFDENNGRISLAIDRTAVTKSHVTLSCPSGSTPGILNIGLNSVTAALFVRHRLYRERYIAHKDRLFLPLCVSVFPPPLSCFEFVAALSFLPGSQFLTCSSQ